MANVKTPAAKKTATSKAVAPVVNAIPVVEDSTPAVEPDIVSAVVAGTQLQQAEIMLPAHVELEDTKGVLTSKGYMKGMIEYASPAKMLSGTIDVMRRLNIDGCKLRLDGEAEQKNINADGSKNVSFGRLNLIAEFDIDEDTHYEIGVLIALDLSQPRIKIFRGARVRACNNLCVWGADDIIECKFVEGVNHNFVENMLLNAALHIEKSISIIQALKAMPVTPVQVEALVGRIIYRTESEKKLCGTTSVLYGVKLMVDPKNKYYAARTGFNGWDFYNACTEYFDGKVSAFDIPEKSRDLYTLLTSPSV